MRTDDARKSQIEALQASFLKWQTEENDRLFALITERIQRRGVPIEAPELKKEKV